ncbi:MAG TPA: carboxypeptidase-like regulatory domain-containing protein [Terriglobales bacterium]|nr:carboxypeptidase-like regulatory domain-containing protein [Terriglobales bacterium]
MKRFARSYRISCALDLSRRSFRLETVGLLLLLAFFSSSSLAQTVSGIITNGTTGKPAANVEVTLLTLSSGMSESGTTKTDAQGNYSMPMENTGGPHLVRATYQGANYFTMLPPGTTQGNISIYDGATKVDGITGTVDVMKLQSDGKTLQAIELWAVNNNSNPARTLTADNSFEIVLPDGAQIDEADAQSPNGQPIQAMPVPLKAKNHYAFNFALKPGETRFQVAYHMPYNGAASISPKLLMPYEHFVVMVPTSMKLDLKNPSGFQPMSDQPGSTVQVARAAGPGTDVSFKISGTGAIPENPQQVQGGQGTAGAQQDDNRPGGGLGPPIDAPDALAKYRWPMLIGLLVVLFGVAYLALSRTSGQAPVTAEGVPLPIPDQPARALVASAPVTPTSAAPAKSGNALLDAMKDELFQLEIERQQGQISAEEYETQKAALDQTLKRALARSQKNS